MGGATGVDFCAVRLLADGSLDTSFDGDGRLTIAIAPGTRTDQGRSVALHAAGDIVIGGRCDSGGATGWDLCIVHLNADGSLDTAFDGDGRRSDSLSVNVNDDYGFDVAVLEDGRTYLAGLCSTVAITALDFCALRYNLDGSLDTTFDGDGALTRAFLPTADSWNADSNMALAPDGRIVAVTECGFAGWTFCVAQYEPGGLVDQYDDAGNDDWDTVGANIGHFGACLQAMTLGTPAWTVNATCPTDDGAFWRAVPTTASTIATANPLTTTATATIRFGTRIANDYPTGDYIAPITFAVTAP
jgi:uncharacterized delta-60 repeat protein